MTAETDINTTPAVADAPVTPVETPVETPTAPPIIEPQPLSSPAPEPAVADSASVAAPAKEAATADKPIEPTPTPTSQPPAPPPPPAPAPVADNPIKRLLAKAKEKIQFRKQAKLEKIMVFAKDKGGISNDQAQKLLRISDATATRYLVQLTKNGRLRLVGKSKAARYIPAQ